MKSWNFSGHSTETCNNSPRKMMSVKMCFKSRLIACIHKETGAAEAVGKEGRREDKLPSSFLPYSGSVTPLMLISLSAYARALALGSAAAD